MSTADLVLEHVREHGRMADLAGFAARIGRSPAAVLSALHNLKKRGRVTYVLWDMPIRIVGEAPVQVEAEADRAMAAVAAVFVGTRGAPEVLAAAASAFPVPTGPLVTVRVNPDGTGDAFMCGQRLPLRTTTLPSPAPLDHYDDVVEAEPPHVKIEAPPRPCRRLRRVRIMRPSPAAAVVMGVDLAPRGDDVAPELAGGEYSYVVVDRQQRILAGFRAGPDDVMDACRYQRTQGGHGVVRTRDGAWISRMVQ